MHCNFIGLGNYFHSFLLSKYRIKEFPACHKL